MEATYQGTRGNMVHTEAGLFWYGNDGFNGVLSGEYTDVEALEIFKQGDKDARGVFNAKEVQS